MNPHLGQNRVLPVDNTSFRRGH